MVQDFQAQTFRVQAVSILTVLGSSCTQAQADHQYRERPTCSQLSTHPAKTIDM